MTSKDNASAPATSGGGSLADAHRQHLLEELGSDEAVGAAVRSGARSITAEEAKANGYSYRGHASGGLLLPFGGAFGQLRCDDPPTARNGDRLKYLNRAGVRQEPATFGDGEPTMATEGWKDALRLHLATGATVQAIPGVTSWHSLAPTVELLIYDADAATNPAVWVQLVRAGLERPALRLAFFPVHLAGPKGGACEYFKAAAAGAFDAIERYKARELLRALPNFWDKNLRVDWQARALRHLARLALVACLGIDATRQLVAAAAKEIGLRVDRARQIAAEERRKLQPPPETPPPSAAPEVRLVAAAGVPLDGAVNAGAWRKALASGVGRDLRLNRLGHLIEYCGQPLEAEGEELLYVTAQAADWRITKQDCYDGTRAAARAHGFHPVQLYLESVANDPTIAPIDLDTVADRYLGVPDPLSAAMVRCLLIGAVARIYEPGCIAPAVLVLQGDQGIGKTEFWRGLAGPFYVVSAEHRNEADTKQSMHQSWIYDLDELDRITTTRQAASLRSLITSPTDTFRLPYARRPESLARSFVIVASVNGEGFLRDPEGSRRFWVIECPQRKDSGQYIDGPGVTRDRDAIWKAATLAYRAGVPWLLTPQEQAASNVRNGAWEAFDEWESSLANWADRNPTHGGFTTDEAIIGSGLRQADHISRPDQMRASDALRRAGFERKANPVFRPGGERVRVWLPSARSLPVGTVLTQPAQPRHNLSGEVVSAETAGAAVGLPPLTQPAQPFRAKKGGGTKGGGEQGEGHVCRPLDSYEAKKVVQVVSAAETAGPDSDLGDTTSSEVVQEVGQLPAAAAASAPAGAPPGALQTATELVADALAALRLAPASTAADAVWRHLEAAGTGVSRRQVDAALDVLVAEEAADQGDLDLGVQP